jgi:hypothetical protein
MKRILICTFLLMSIEGFSQVGIGTISPSNSAILELESITRGFLPPRLSKAQRDAISNPATGLMIYNTTSKCVEWNNGLNGTHDWYFPCGYSLPAINTVFDSISIKMNSITSSRLLTSDADEPEVSAPAGRVGTGISNCFVDWVSDALDYGGWIFIDQPNLNNIASANLLPYMTNVASTGGSISTHPLLSGKQYFTNFSTNRKLFSFYAQVENNTSIKIISDSGIDTDSGPSVQGNSVSTNGKYHMYYQSASRNANIGDAFLTHMFFVRSEESSTITFETYNTDLGASIGNQTPASDDYSAILKWQNSGEVNEVYGFMMVLGQNDTQAGPNTTVSELETIANNIVENVLP